MGDNLKENEAIAYSKCNINSMLGINLELQLSEAQILIDLGLTLKQARVYLVLSKFGPLEISEISKISKVARPDVYKATSTLQKQGLLEEIIRRPIEYKAISIDEGIKILLGAKEEQFEKMKKESKILLATIKNIQSIRRDQIEESRISLISGKNLFQSIRNSIEKAQSSIDLILSFKRFSQGIVNRFIDSLEIAWKKNVKTRFLLDHPPENEMSYQIINLYKEKPFEVRFLPFYPKTIFAIYDKREILIVTNPQIDLSLSPALRTTNDSIIDLAADHFNCLWTKAHAEHSNSKSSQLF